MTAQDGDIAAQASADFAAAAATVEANISLRQADSNLTETPDQRRNSARPKPGTNPETEPLSTSDASFAITALPGFVARYVEEAADYTEGDPAAMLVQALAGFGAMLGPNVFTTIGDRQPPLIYPVIVGNTAKARKGSSWNPVRRLFEAVEPEFARTRIMNGFGSGEALIDAVRDPEDDDERAPDRRLLVVETEYAKHLKVCARDTSILSAVIRNAYDGNRLENRTRGRGTITATNPHIAFVGHVVVDELRRYLSASEIAGGFANRHLYIRAKRSQTLPRAAELAQRIIESHAAIIRGAVVDARHVGEVGWTPDADSMWDNYLRPMMDGDDEPGLLGAVVARPEANTARLATLFALSDRVDEIDVAHLQAAWDVWQASRAACEALFGDLTGNPAIDRLLDALEGSPDGLDGAGVAKILSRHNVRETVREALDRGMVVRTRIATGGRPRDVYRLAEGSGR